MRKGLLKDKIIFALTWLGTYVEHLNQTGRIDENLDLEDFFCIYLNICLKTSLSNLNKGASNYPGIDLGDKKLKKSFQITSNGNRSKILKTIEKFEAHKLYKEFDELNVLIIGKKPQYKSGFKINGKYTFDKNNIVGIKELVCQLELLDNEQLEKIISLFEAEYEGIFLSYDSRQKTKIKVADQETYPELEAPIKLKNNGFPNQALKLLNEIERAKFDEADDEFKYKLLVNKGLCQLDLINNKEAAEHFIEALKFRSSNDKSLGFAALGKFLIGEEGNAEELALEALKINPKSELAYTTLINVWSKSDDFESKVKKIPNSVKDTAGISYQLGKKYQEEGNYENAKKYFEIAIQKSDRKDADIKGALGTLILENYLNPFLYVTGQLDEQAKNEIRKAASILEDAWKEIENSELRSSRTLWLVNLAVAKKVLNDPDGALFDLKLASSVAPKELFTQRQYAISLFESGDMEGALNQIKKCKELDTTNDLFFDLFEAEVYYKSGDSQECLNIIRGKLKDKDFDGQQETTFLEIACLANLGNIDDAIIICNVLIESNQFKIRALINKAKMLKSKGDYDGFKSSLDEAVGVIDDTTSQENIHDVVNLLGLEERYSELISLLLRITNKEAYSELTKLLITAYFNTGNYKSALNLISNLKARVGLQDYLVDIESIILYKIHDYNGAEKICQEYLKKDPNHPFILMKLAIILSKTEDVVRLKETLLKIQNVEIRPLDFRFQYANLLAQCDDLDRSLECALNARRDNFRNAQAHLSYFQLFNQIGQNIEKSLLEIEKAYFDTSVHLLDEKTGEIHIKTLLNTDNPKYERGELGNSDELTKELISKRKGDTVEDKNKMITYRIKEITSKYVSAFRETIHLLSTEYQNESGFETFSLPAKEEGEEIDFRKDFDPIYNKIKENESFHKMIETQYKAGSLPIGSFASFSRKNFIWVWIHLVQSNNLGISHYRNDNECIQGISLIRSGKNVVLTLSSLLSIYHVAKNKISQLSCKKFVAQSSIDTIIDLLDEFKDGVDRGGLFFVSKVGDQFYREEVTVENLQKTLDHYSEFKKWCETHFIILPNEKEKEINKSEKEQQDQILGESFIDSINIAEKNDAIIIDDDSLFRQLVKEKFNISGIGAYSLAKYWLEMELIDNDQFYTILYDLSKLNYRKIPCSKDFLVFVTEKLEYKLSMPLTDLISEFGSEFFEMSTAINILVLYLKEVYLRTNQITFEKFADFIIQILMRRRNFIKAKSHFFNSLLVHFKLLDIQRNRIVEIWNLYERI